MTDVELPYAPIWRRLAAMLIDVVVFGIVTLGVSKLGLGLYEMLVAKFVVPFLYFFLTEASPLRASPGKWLMGLYVGDAAGGAAGVVNVALRAFVCFMAAIPAGLFVLGEAMQSASSAIDAAMYNMSRSGAAVMNLPAEHEATLLKMNVLSALSFGYVLLFIAMPAAVTRTRAGLHDRISGTRVFSRRAAKTA